MSILTSRSASSAPTPASGPRRPTLSRGLVFVALRIASLVAGLGFWQWYGSRPDQYAVAPPTKVIPSLIDGITSGEFLVALGGTMGFMLVGLAIAAFLGIALGLLIASSEVADNTLTPLVNAANMAPMTLLIPIIGVYTGIDFWGKVFLVAAFAVFVILINTEAGVRAVSGALHETAESFSVTRWQLVRHVILPATTPYIATGLRLGVGRAFRGAIVADLLLAVAHLGEIIVTAGSTFNAPRMLAGILFTTIVGVVLMTLAELVERRATRWRPTSN
jgi:ABC-type nitrate/sulfonate/bicarbonate transport system permease component